MSEESILDCIKNNPPEALVPFSKVFGSILYIISYHIFKNLPENDSMDLNNSAEVFVNFMTDYIGKGSAKYMEHDSVDEAVDAYVKACQWLVEHKITNREEILEVFIFFVLPTKPLRENMYLLNDLTIHVRGKNCLAFIIDPLKLSQDQVYQTISGVDAGLSLYYNGLVKKLEWKTKINCLLRPVFISMLHPEILEHHFKAMTAGTAIVFEFDKISSLEDMDDYIKSINYFSKEEKYPPGFNTDKMFNYKTREDALLAYTVALEELCSQCAAGAKAVFLDIVMLILASTICGNITAETTPELFILVKDLARPLKLSEAELRASIDQGVKYVDEIFVSGSITNTSC